MALNYTVYQYDGSKNAVVMTDMDGKCFQYLIVMENTVGVQRYSARNQIFLKSV